MSADLGPDAGAWLTIAVMAAVTVGIRCGGFWLMGYVPLTRRVRSILNALPGAVIMAIMSRLTTNEPTTASGVRSESGLPRASVVRIAHASSSSRRITNAPAVTP